MDINYGLYNIYETDEFRKLYSEVYNLPKEEIMNIMSKYKYLNVNSEEEYEYYENLKILCIKHNIHITFLEDLMYNYLSLKYNNLDDEELLLHYLYYENISLKKIKNINSLMKLKLYINSLYNSRITPEILKNILSAGKYIKYYNLIMNDNNLFAIEKQLKNNNDLSRNRLDFHF